MRVKKKPSFEPFTRKINPLINPFAAAESFVIKVNTLVSEYNINKASGKPQELDLESTPFTKVFRTPEYRKLTMSLSPGARSN